MNEYIVEVWSNIRYKGNERNILLSEIRFSVNFWVTLSFDVLTKIQNFKNYYLDLK